MAWFVEHRYFNRVSGWVSLANSVALAPQLVSVIENENVEAVSIPMWLIFIALQTTFTLMGIKTKNTLMFWSMLVSILISLAVIGVVLYKT